MSEFVYPSTWLFSSKSAFSFRVPSRYFLIILFVLIPASYVSFIEISAGQPSTNFSCKFTSLRGWITAVFQTFRSPCGKNRTWSFSWCFFWTICCSNWSCSTPWWGSVICQVFRRFRTCLHSKFTFLSPISTPVFDNEFLGSFLGWDCLFFPLFRLFAWWKTFYFLILSSALIQVVIGLVFPALSDRSDAWLNCSR